MKRPISMATLLARTALDEADPDYLMRVWRSLSYKIMSVIDETELIMSLSASARLLDGSVHRDMKLVLDALHSYRTIAPSGAELYTLAVVRGALKDALMRRGKTEDDFIPF